MTGRGIETRIRKLEVKYRPGSGPWFFVWGRTPEEIETTFNTLPGSKPTHSVVSVTWTGSEPPPEPRWGTARSLTPEELMSVLEDRCGPESTWPTNGERDPRARQMTDEMLDDALLAVVLREGSRP